MSMKMATGKQILGELNYLRPNRWADVLNFIRYLKYQDTVAQEQTEQPALTAHNLLQSELVGLWAERGDIGDSLVYARQLRYEAEHR